MILGDWTGIQSQDSVGQFKLSWGWAGAPFVDCLANVLTVSQTAQLPDNITPSVMC